MNLSRNFTLQELIKSDTAIRLDINNNPNSGQIEKLKALCENILQPVRDHFGRVKVTSGFRSEQLSQTVGGYIAAILLTNLENNFYTHTNLKVKQNINL
jgi:hypothetical protein